ncbi:TolC family protein [Candidatus Cyanaurora vandensis]|uniref:TolC family protein n=1 Tax=Candidatus Cyanaurora vandensis TaxID=2714958 RepID=UPI00257D3446|nr:TolC family protein [Candidatus Cyanaurora vandensis]
MFWRSVGVLLLWTGGPVLAQTTTRVPPNFEIRLEKAARPLSLKEAVGLALDQNQDILKARNNVFRAEAGVRAALALRSPNLSTTSSYTGQELGATPFANNVNLQGTVGWTVYDASREPQIEAAQLTRERTTLDLQTQERNIALSVTTAYFNLQRADSDVTIQEAAVTNAQANSDQTRKRQQAGLATRFDVLQQEVQLANSRQSLFAAQNEQARTRLVLADLLNLSQSIPARAADPIAPNPDWTQDLAATLDLALDRRSELSALERNVAIASAQQATDNGQVLPRLTVSAGYGFNDNLRGFNQPQTILGASLSWQLYDGGASVARQEQLEYDKRNLRLDVSQTAQRIRSDIEQAYLAKETAKAQMGSSQVAVNQASEGLQLIQRRRQLGLSLQIEVITAERSLTEARQNYANAVISYNRALAELGLAVGV